MNDGLFMVEYQVVIEETVKILPKIPTNSQPTTEMINFGKVFIDFSMKQFGVKSN